MHRDFIKDLLVSHEKLASRYSFECLDPAWVQATKTIQFGDPVNPVLRFVNRTVSMIGQTSARNIANIYHLISII